MKSTTEQSSGKLTASIVSVAGLILVWGIVWANLPSKEEWLSAQSQERASAAPLVPELDLTIPGVPSGPPSGTSARDGMAREPAAPSVTSNGFNGSGDLRSRQIAEVKCEAEVQQVCPDALRGEARRECVAKRMRQLTPVCRQIVRQRMVRWKEAEGYLAACADDMKRVCRDVEPGDGRILQCLHDRAQDISEGCYQSLPKGHLLLRN